MSSCWQQPGNAVRTESTHSITGISPPLPPTCAIGSTTDRPLTDLSGSSHEIRFWQQIANGTGNDFRIGFTPFCQRDPDRCPL